MPGVFPTYSHCYRIVMLAILMAHCVPISARAENWDPIANAEGTGYRWVIDRDSFKKIVIGDKSYAQANAKEIGGNDPDLDVTLNVDLHECLRTTSGTIIITDAQKNTVTYPWNEKMAWGNASGESGILYARLAEYICKEMQNLIENRNATQPLNLVATEVSGTRWYLDFGSVTRADDKFDAEGEAVVALGNLETTVRKFRLEIDARQCLQTNNGRMKISFKNLDGEQSEQSWFWSAPAGNAPPEVFDLLGQSVCVGARKQ